MLKWDATFLNDFSRECILSEDKIDGITLWQFIFKDKIYVAEVRVIDSLVYSLIDEFKPLFLLPKLGTHTCKISGKLYQIIKPIKDRNGIVLLEKTLNNYTVDPKSILRKQIQDVFIMREIFGFIRSNEKCLRMRQIGNRILVLSYKEGKYDLHASKGCMSTVLYETWFSDTEPHEVLCRLLSLDKEESLPAILDDLRDKMIKIADRVYKDYTYVDNLLGRIQSMAIVIDQ